MYNTSHELERLEVELYAVSVLALDRGQKVLVIEERGLLLNKETGICILWIG